MYLPDDGGVFAHGKIRSTLIHFLTHLGFVLRVTYSSNPYHTLCPDLTGCPKLSGQLYVALSRAGAFDQISVLALQGGAILEKYRRALGKKNKKVGVYTRYLFTFLWARRVMEVRMRPFLDLCCRV